jgi:hypothetical protein
MDIEQAFVDLCANLQLGDDDINICDWHRPQMRRLILAFASAVEADALERAAQYIGGLPPTGPKGFGRAMQNSQPTMRTDMADAIRALMPAPHEPDNGPCDADAATTIARLTAALRGCATALIRIESANDAIGGARTEQMYLTMIDEGQQDILQELDDARRMVRDCVRGIREALGDKT